MLHDWLLAFMVAMVPPGHFPERETRDAALERYDSIADDVLAEVHASPIFTGPDGEAMSASLVIALAVHESGLRLDVDQGITRGEGRDSCLMQIRDASLEVVNDRRACFRDGIRIIKRSMRQCQKSARRDQLAAYASGSCDRGVNRSHEIVDMWRRAYAAHPPPKRPAPFVPFKAAS